MHLKTGWCMYKSEFGVVAAGAGTPNKIKTVRFRPKQAVRLEEQWNEKGSGSTERGVGTQNSCRVGWMSM